jgi:hypothetical protein
MPTPRKLPASDTLLRLRDQGWKLWQIGEQYGVTEAAVWKAVSQSRNWKPRRTVSDLLPWEISDAHKAVAIMERFRSMLKEERGDQLSVNEARLLNMWRHDMDEAGLVVDYHPDAPPNSASRKGGFFYTPRLEGDDGYIRRSPES